MVSGKDAGRRECAQRERGRVMRWVGLSKLSKICRHVFIRAYTIAEGVAFCKQNVSEILGVDVAAARLDICLQHVFRGLAPPG